MYIVKEREVNKMKKFIIWLLIKSIVPKMKVKFVEDGSSFEYETNTIYLDLNENCDGFMRHLHRVHFGNYESMFGFHLGLYDIKKTVWQVLHEIGHYFTLDIADEDEDEQIERAICSLIDRDTAENNEQIMNMYFNLDKEYQATEWAIDYANYHYRKIRLFNKLLGG